MTSTSLVRPYRGVTAEGRVQQRREALIDAALEVFDTEGWAALSARRMCEQAGLTRRYFYENFNDIDALIGAVFEQVTDEVRAALSTAIAQTDKPLAIIVRDALSAGLDVLTKDPAKGRFLSIAQSAGHSIAH